MIRMMHYLNENVVNNYYKPKFMNNHFNKNCRITSVEYKN